jgi:hypothetical protein
MANPGQLASLKKLQWNVFFGITATCLELHSRQPQLDRVDHITSCHYRTMSGEYVHSTINRSKYDQAIDQWMKPIHGEAQWHYRTTRAVITNRVMSHR